MTTSTSAPGTTISGKYLTVILAGEAYGVGVLKVREIIRVPKVTPVPQMPAGVKGVINLRGRVIPIIDLRERFDLAATPSERACVIVVEVRLGNERPAPMGLIVDEVAEVVSLSPEAVEPAPNFGSASRSEYILGMAKVADRVTTLLDIDRLIGAESAATISTLAL